MQAGGPYKEVLTGRRDSVSASTERADKQLPASRISIDKFIWIFGHYNIIMAEGVALIGTYNITLNPFNYEL